MSGLLWGWFVVVCHFSCEHIHTDLITCHTRIIMLAPRPSIAFRGDSRIKPEVCVSATWVFRGIPGCPCMSPTMFRIATSTSVCLLDIGCLIQWRYNKPKAEAKARAKVVWNMRGYRRCVSKQSLHRSLHTHEMQERLPDYGLIDIGGGL